MRVSSQSLGVIHFIGIGGIGMSGVAEILNSLGYQVRGSDLYESKNVTRLRALGISIVIGQKQENIEGASVVVMSSAINDDNPELIAAREADIPVVKRAEMLGEIMRLRPCISVAGTHGKTTTTSIAAGVLDHGGLDPTVVSGGIINAYGTNARLGSGAWMLVEADESDGTFAKLPATIAIVTNIEAEHMDHYGSFESVKSAFQSYIQNIPFYGLAILCADHPVTDVMSEQISDRRVITYGIANPESDVRGVNVRCTPQGHYFDLELSVKAQKNLNLTAYDQSQWKNFFVPMVGHHNVLNAISVIVCSLELGMTINQIQEGLSAFLGVERRFTILGDLYGVTIVDDYAHHPTEIKATLSAAKQVISTDNKTIAVIQPHRYSRLTDLYLEFTSSFDDADMVVVLPIYAAGEMPSLTVSSQSLAESLTSSGKDVFTISKVSDIDKLLQDHGDPGDICVFMGAGDISTQCHDYFHKKKGVLLDMKEKENVIVNSNKQTCSSVSSQKIKMPQLS